MPVWQMTLSRNHCFSIPLDPKHNHFKSLTPYFSRSLVKHAHYVLQFSKAWFPYGRLCRFKRTPCSEQTTGTRFRRPLRFLLSKWSFLSLHGAKRLLLLTQLYARSIYKLKMAAINDVLFGVKRSFANKQERNAGSTGFGLEPYTEIFLCRMHTLRLSQKKSVARSNVSVFPFGLFSSHIECLSQFGPAVFSAFDCFCSLLENLLQKHSKC